MEQVLTILAQEENRGEHAFAVLSFDGEKQLLQDVSKWDPGRDLAQDAPFPLDQDEL